MLIAHCPRCDEGFRIPSGEIPQDAHARCPWCGETFPFTEVWNNLPPSLQIVTADGEPLAIGSRAASVGAGLQLLETQNHQHSLGSKRVGPDVETNPSAMIELDPHATIVDESVYPTQIDGDWNQRMSFVSAERHADHSPDDDPYATWDSPRPTSFQSMNVSSNHNRVRIKRKGSGIGTFIGVVLGGLLAIPLAGGILMLFGRTPDWGFWPFNGQSGSISIRAATPLPERSSPASAEGSNAGSPRGTPLRFNRDSMLTDDEADPAEIVAREYRDTSESEDDTSSADLTGQEDGANESDRPRSLADDQANATDSSVSASLPSRGGSSPSASDADELANRAIQMITVMTSDRVSEDEQQRRLARTYQTIATAVGQTDRADDPLRAMAERIVASPFVDELCSTGWQWISSTKRETDGTALVGTVSRLEGVQVLVGDSDQVVALTGDIEFPSEQRLLILGRLNPEGTSVDVIHAEPTR